MGVSRKEQAPPELGSDELARRAHGGDRDAFDELVRRYHPIVAEQVRTVLGPAAPVEELVRETFEACRGRLGQEVPFTELALREATRLARRRRRSPARLWLAGLTVALAAGVGAAVLLRQPPCRQGPAQVVETKPVNVDARAGTAQVPVHTQRVAPDARIRRARRARPGRARATSSDAAPAPDTRPRKVVVLPGRVKGDDHVITVAPAAKIKPLFDAEEFKRRGMRRILGGREPVKPAPEGIEDEVD
jgi:DNA-directed RNA polymerase specialized sigma24 family protein